MTFFNECYKKYYPTLYRFINSRVGNIYTTEDLCQEVFSRFSIHIAQVHPAAVRSWLLSTARNVLFEHARRESGDVTEDIEDLSIVADESFLYPQPDNDFKIILADIRNTLTLHERIIHDNISHQLYSEKEIAQQLGLTPRQVRYKAGLVRKKIHAALLRYGIKGTSDFIFFWITTIFFVILGT